MTEKYDLTTTEGRMAFFRKFSRNCERTRTLTPIIGYSWASLVADVIESVEDFFGTGEPLIDQQKCAAVEIIKAGRINGVETLEITLSQKAGLELGSDIGGIPVTATIGQSGKMTIKVRYTKET